VSWRAKSCLWLTSNALVEFGWLNSEPFCNGADSFFKSARGFLPSLFSQLCNKAAGYLTFYSATWTVVNQHGDSFSAKTNIEAYQIATFAFFTCPRSLILTAWNQNSRSMIGNRSALLRISLRCTRGSHVNFSHTSTLLAAKCFLPSRFEPQSTLLWKGYTDKGWRADNGWCKSSSLCCILWVWVIFRGRGNYPFFIGWTRGKKLQERALALYHNQMGRWILVE
jgi:hypothetical protein